jgi:uncharacterized protein
METAGDPAALCSPEPEGAAHPAAERRRGRWASARAVAVAIVAVTFLGHAVRSAGAQDAANLYQYTVITTGSDLRYRAAGFGRALRTVLVKVSGEPRLLRDPRVDRLAREPDLFIASFDYVDQMAGIKHHDDQGTYDRPFNLTVHFVPSLIDKALEDLGAPPWRGQRPVVVPVIAVRGPGASYLLDAEIPAGAAQRGALVEVAQEFALAVRFPTEADFTAWQVTLGPFPSPQTAPSPDEAIVAGTLEFQQTVPGWAGSWKMRWRGVEYAWGIRGVNFDEALRDLVRGVARVASGRGAPD